PDCPRRPALDGVRQVEEVLEIEAESADLPTERHPCRSGPLAAVLDAPDAGGLTDEGEPGVGAPGRGCGELPIALNGGTGPTGRDASEQTGQPRGGSRAPCPRPSTARAAPAM